jgi:hypothetical protein
VRLGLRQRYRRADEIRDIFRHGGALPEKLRQVWPRLALISCWADATAATYFPALKALFPAVTAQANGLPSTEACVSFPLGTDVGGPMEHFDSSLAYSCAAVRWAGHSSGPNDLAMLDAATSFGTSEFLNPVAGTFGWSLDSADRQLSLVYTPTAAPEPGTSALVDLVAAGLSRWRRRGQPTSRAHHGLAQGWTTN